MRLIASLLAQVASVLIADEIASCRYSMVDAELDGDQEASEHFSALYDRLTSQEPT